jgi:hypothetical protein
MVKWVTGFMVLIAAVSVLSVYLQPKAVPLSSAAAIPGADVRPAVPAEAENAAVPAASLSHAEEMSAGRSAPVQEAPIREQILLQ